MKRNRSVGENDDKKIKSETGQRDEKRREREFGLRPGLFFCLFCFDFNALWKLESPVIPVSRDVSEEGWICPHALLAFAFFS